MMEATLDRLRSSGGLNTNDFDDFMKAGLVSALLHDIGHGPFSHLSEKFLKFEHEDITTQIILESHVGDILQKDGVKPQRVVDILRHVSTGEDVLLSQLVSSQLDVDRLDYLARDAYFTGVGFGNIDLGRIIAMLRIYDGEGTLHGHALTLFKGRHSIEAYVLGRHLMYQSVYFHKAGRGAEKLIENAFRRAIETKSLPEKFSFLYERTPRVGDILGIDDHDVIVALRSWQNSKDPILSDLSKRFFQRRLLKAIELTPKRLNEHLDRIAKFQGLAQRHNIDSDYFCPIDGPSDTAYTPYKLRSPEDKRTGTTNIFVFDEDGKPCEISDISDVVKALSKTDYLNRLYVPDTFKEAAQTHLFKK